MQHLKKFSSVIYIDTPLEIIIKRIDIGQERGLAVPKDMSVAEVYYEREPLYRKHSDFILNGSKSIDELFNDVKKIFLNEGYKQIFIHRVTKTISDILFHIYRYIMVGSNSSKA